MDTRSPSLRMRASLFFRHNPDYWRDIVVSSVSSPIGIVISRVY